MQNKNILNSLLIVLTGIACIFLFRGFFNLLVGDNLPVDLAIRYWHTKNLLINHENIFLDIQHPLYPPSFFVFLYPLLSLTSYANIDLVWGFTNLFYLFLISIWLYKSYNNSNVGLQKYQTFILPLLFLCFHSISQGLGIGQVTLFIIGNLVLYYWIKEKFSQNIFFSIIGILALSISLNKYSLLIPFAILFLLRKKYRLDIVLAIGLNLIISLFALNFVNSSFKEFFIGLIKNSAYVNNLGSLDLQSAVSYLGLSNIYFYLAILILLSLFIIRLIKFKITDIIDELALSALVARFFIYHAHYDNVILVFLLVAIWKKIPSFNTWNRENILLALVALSLIIPARFLEWESPTFGIFLMYQLLVWIYSGYFLVKNSTIQAST